MKLQHQIRLGTAEIELAEEFLDACKVYRTPKDVPVPAPNGPPVQGLDVISGYACEEIECHYACVDADTITRHLREAHGETYKGESRPKVPLQTLFHAPAQYFRVNPALSNSASPDLISALSDTFIAEATQPPPRLTAERDGDSTPFHQLLGFDGLLLTVRQNRESTQ